MFYLGLSGKGFINKPDFDKLSEQFLKGVSSNFEFTKRTFFMIAKQSPEEYKNNLIIVKQLLSKAGIAFYKNLILISSDKDITREQKIVLVRYINMCHHNKQYIILYNDTIVYTPPSVVEKTAQLYVKISLMVYYIKNKLNSMNICIISYIKNININTNLN